MITLNQQKSEIDMMNSFFLKGLYNEYQNVLSKSKNPPRNVGIEGENTGEIDEDDYDTSMWFQ